MAKTASPSGRQGLSYILQILCSPLPFLRYSLEGYGEDQERQGTSYLVVEA